VAFLDDDGLALLQSDMAKAKATPVTDWGAGAGAAMGAGAAAATPKPTWNTGGYYQDNLGHYSNDGGASWGYQPTPTTDWGGASASTETPDFSSTYNPAAQPRLGYGDAVGSEPYNPGVDWGAFAQAPTPDNSASLALNYGGGQDAYIGPQAQQAPNWMPEFVKQATPNEGFLGDVGSGLGTAAGFVKDYGFGVKGTNQGSIIGSGLPGNTVDTTPGQALEGAGLMMSGNKFAGAITGKDLNELPYGLNYLTDTLLAPATVATALAGPSVPIIGSAFKGGLAKRFAGETAVGTAGYFGGAKSSELASEYTDNPWLIGGAGLAGGLATGIGAYGAFKAGGKAVGAADRALTGLDASINEPAYMRGVQTAGMERQVFHGTPDSALTLADLKPGELTGRGTSAGLFFTENPDVAGAYLGRGNGRTIEATIEDKNFLDLTDERVFHSFLKDQGFDAGERRNLWALAEEGRLYDDNVGRTQSTIIRYAKNAGYDGVKMNDAVPGYFERGLEPVDVSYVVLDPTKPGVITSLGVSSTHLAPDSGGAVTRGMSAADPNFPEVRPPATATGGTRVVGEVPVSDVVRPDVPIDGLTPTQRMMQEPAKPSAKAAPATAPDGTPYTTSSAPPPRTPTPPSRMLNEDPEYLAGVRKILDTTTQEANIRRVGTADREIKAGRGRQFGNIDTALNSGTGDAAQTLSDARSASAVGKLRKTTAEAIDLTPSEKNAILTDVIERVRNDELPPWAIYNVTGADSALEKLLRGDGLQPAEIKWVRETFGDEIANAVADRPLTDAAEALASRAYNDKAVARQEAALAAEVQADNVRDNRLLSTRQETSDRAVQRTRWKTIAKTNSLEDIQQRLADPFLTAEERTIAQKALTEQASRAQNEAGKVTDAIWERAKKANPDADQIRRKADALIDKMVTDPQVNAQFKQTAALWEAGNRVILDGIGENRVQEVASTIGHMISGDVADSHLATLIHRRSYLQSALEQLDPNMDTALIKKAANVLLKRELKIRYPNGVPDNITEMLNSTKSLSYSERGLLSGAADISQRLKNTQFGIGDMAVFGQQVLKAITTGGPNILAGLVNDTLSMLHLPHIRTLYAESNLPKMIQHQLDGVAQGVSTGITDLSREGTIFSEMGRVGRKIDSPIVYAVGKLTDFQFKTVLGALRNLNHEGNLVMLRLAGQDIQNPAVRATAAAFANSNTSFWMAAQRTGRAQFEKATLLSPSMRRAQVAQLRQVTKLLDGNGAERIMAATTIAAFGTSLLIIGKLVNDYVGVEDFEFDPSKPGFGKITVPRPGGGKNLVLNVFPQEQVLTAFAKAIRVLAENPDKEGGFDAAKEIGKLLLGSSSPALRIGEGAAGFGFDPQESKYKFGDLNDGKGWIDKVMNMSPIPPAGADLINKGFDSFRTPLGFLGINNYDESGYQPRDRKAQELFQKEYSQLDTLERAAVDKANGGKVVSTNPDVQKSIANSSAIRAQNVVTQKEIDAKHIMPGTTIPKSYEAGKAWRKEYDTAQFAIAKQYDAKDVIDPFTGKPYGSDMDKARAAYFAVIDNAKNGTDVDWEKVDAWRASHPTESALVDKYTAGKANTDLTEVVTAKKAAAKQVGDAGLFDLRDNLWAELNASTPAPNYIPGQGYYEWRDMLIARTEQEMIASGVSQSIAHTKAETAVDTKHPVVSRFNDVYKSTVLYPWVDANPDVALTAVQWGYLYPDTLIQKFLQFKESGQ